MEIETKTFSFIEALKYGVITFIEHFDIFLKLLLLSIGLVFIPLIAGIVLLIFAYYTISLIQSSLAIAVILLGIGALSLFLVFLSFWYTAGVIHICFKLYDQKPVQVRDVFIPKILVLRYIGASILYILLVTLGTLLLIIPGIVFALMYYFVTYAIIDQHTTIGQGFSISNKLTYGVKWRFFVFEVLLGIILALLNMPTKGLAGLITGPIIMLIHISIYRQLQKKTPVNKPLEI